MDRLAIFFLLVACFSLSAACDRTVKLEQDQKTKFIGMQYGKTAQYFRSLGLDPSPVYRPTTNAQQHGRILETNPHFNGVSVCEGHRTKVYIGVFPYIEMPDLQGLSLDLAKEKLREKMAPRNIDGISSGDINIQPIRSGDIASQIPKAGEWLHIDLKVDGRTEPRLVDTGKFAHYVVVDSEPKVCPQCQACAVCKAPVTPASESPTDAKATVLTSIVGTLGASTVLIYAMGGPASVVNSLAQRGIVAPVCAAIAPPVAARSRRYRLRLKRAP